MPKSIRVEICKGKQIEFSCYFLLFISVRGQRIPVLYLNIFRSKMSAQKSKLCVAFFHSIFRLFFRHLVSRFFSQTSKYFDRIWKRWRHSTPIVRSTNWSVFALAVIWLAQLTVRLFHWNEACLRSVWISPYPHLTQLLQSLCEINTAVVASWESVATLILWRGRSP